MEDEHATSVVELTEEDQVDITFKVKKALLEEKKRKDVVTTNFTQYIDVELREGSWTDTQETVLLFPKSKVAFDSDKNHDSSRIRRHRGERTYMGWRRVVSPSRQCGMLQRSQNASIHGDDITFLTSWHDAEWLIRKLKERIKIKSYMTGKYSDLDKELWILNSVRWSSPRTQDRRGPASREGEGRSTGSQRCNSSPCLRSTGQGRIRIEDNEDFIDPELRLEKSTMSRRDWATYPEVWDTLSSAPWSCAPRFIGQMVRSCIPLLGRYYKWSALFQSVLCWTACCRVAVGQSRTKQFL